jgi:hypothetical protein
MRTIPWFSSGFQVHASKSSRFKVDVRSAQYFTLAGTEARPTNLFMIYGRQKAHE